MTNSLKLRFAAVIAALMFCAGAVFAQELPGIDMDRWQELTNRAEASVDAGDIGSLESYRGSLAQYRTKFDEVRNLNASRIASLRDQLTLLGTPPAEGEGVPEAAEVVAQRKELETQLAVLSAPVQVADSAYARADGLIGEIDTALRTQQTQELLEVIGSPVNPAHWPAAYDALYDALSHVWAEVDSVEAAESRADLKNNLPLILISVIAGLILIVQGQKWSKKLVGYFSREDGGGSALGIWRFLVSLLRIVFPLCGLALWSYAAGLTGYLGVRGEELAVAFAVLGGLMLVVRWIAEQIFSRQDSDALLLFSAKERSQLRFTVSGIGLVAIFSTLIYRVLELDEASNLIQSVINFPFTVLIGYGLFRLGRILRHFGRETDEPEVNEPTRASTLALLVRSLGTFTVAVAIGAPVLQAIGLNNASSFVLAPTLLTLVILGLVLVLQRFSADLYGVITGQGLQSREALMPIFFGLILLMLALPILALAWGVRISDMTEIWAAFRRGFAVGNSRISPTDFLTFAAIFTVGYLITRLVQGALKTNVLPKTKIDKGGQNAIVSGLGYVGIFLAALAAITGAGIDLSSLAIVAGALSVGIGFGLQNIVSNFVSGIILLIERPISEGDWIEVSGGQMGYVRDISVRSTRIETFDKTDVIVPNADLVSGTVTNYTRGNTLGRVIVPIGVAYGTDTRKVESILREIAESQPMVLANPAPAILFMKFGASSLDFEIRMYLRDINWSLAVKNDVNHAIAQRFVEEGIEIPFPQQDVWLRTAQQHTPPEQPPEETVAHDTNRVQQRPDDFLVEEDSDDDGDVPAENSDTHIDGDSGL
ncbi:small-conductance mechanosensitive channel [Sulfitobacter undariae]|uniref:Small-conductance mechanosensitive channel n=1 Tax=Sulfitobacter undariae TaxID=1563671 RepID=A0A7W6H1Q4_9RHOB|nr:DUF3772 domain-containing protein [Sulfitobacter undariae]MBB3993994.1 small-conductance mechanosensitive channel [Sulfitobacter undariae]